MELAGARQLGGGARKRALRVCPRDVEEVSFPPAGGYEKAVTTKVSVAPLGRAWIRVPTSGGKRRRIRSGESAGALGEEIPVLDRLREAEFLRAVVDAL